TPPVSLRQVERGGRSMRRSLPLRSGPRSSVHRVGLRSLRARRWAMLLMAGATLLVAPRTLAAGGDVDLFGGVGAMGSSYIQSGMFQRSGGQWLGELGATLGL